MFPTKMCLVLYVFTISGRCQGSSDNSSSPLPLPPAASRRMSEDQAAALRRQLMRDNYDYAHSDDERKQPNFSDKQDDTAKIYYQKDGTDHKPETAELTQADSASQHDEQDSRQEPAGANEASRVQYEEPSQYGQQREHGQEQQPDQYLRSRDLVRARSQEQNLEQPEQFDEEHLAQYEEQTDRTTPSYVNADELTVRNVPRQQYTGDRDADLARRLEEPQTARQMAYNPAYHKKQREALETHQARTTRPFSDLRGDFIEQYEQNDAEQPQQVEQAENAEFTPEEQEALDQQKISDSQDDASDYSRSGSKEKARDMYDAFGYTTRTRLRYRPSDTGAARGVPRSVDRTPPQRKRKPISNQDRDARPGRHHHASPGRNHYGSPRSHHAPPGRNYQPRPGRTRHIHQGRSHYALPGRSRNVPMGRNYQAPAARDYPSDQNYQTPVDRDYQAPEDHNYPSPSGQDRNPPLDHNISKKDLLYYMDDTQLRRNNNEMSPDVPDEEEVTSRQPSTIPGSPGVNRTSPRAVPSTYRASSTPATTKPLNLSSTERARRSVVITVSPANVTYKLLTLKTHEGRRRGERCILEERGPRGVAIISLDHAPLPAFRLPRSRRQYMHDHRHRRPKPA